MTAAQRRYEYYARRAQRHRSRRARRFWGRVAVFALFILFMVAHFWPEIRILTAHASPRSLAVEQSVYYRNCSQARAAGKAPIYIGQPGYREALDADSDGIACEPYR
jgi:hypothetical protein